LALDAWLMYAWGWLVNCLYAGNPRAPAAAAAAAATAAHLGGSSTPPQCRSDACSSVGCSMPPLPPRCASRDTCRCRSAMVAMQASAAIAGAAYRNPRLAMNTWLLSRRLHAVSVIQPGGGPRGMNGRNVRHCVLLHCHWPYLRALVVCVCVCVEGCAVWRACQLLITQSRGCMRRATRPHGGCHSLLGGERG
jgi:hypothetical protein